MNRLAEFRLNKRKTGRNVRMEVLEPRLLLDGAAERVVGLNPNPTGEDHHAWLGDELFFVADDGSGDVELWKSDGTPAGTVRVKDIRPGPKGSFPQSLVIAEDRVVFTAYDNSTGRELWATDGTEQGTVRLTDLRPGDADSLSHDQQLTAIEARVFFDIAGELWVSDGTEAGTKMVKDINNGPEESNRITGLTNVNGKLYFIVSGDDTSQVWESDGSEGGTLPVAYPQLNSVSPADALSSPLISLGPDLFFNTHNEDGGQFWRVDLSSGQSTLLYDDWALYRSRVGDLIFFTNPRSRSSDPVELWRTDGTQAGTFRISTYRGHPSLENFTAVGEELFFTESTSGGRVLWRSDGTIQGTRQVPGANNSPSFLRESSGNLYFTMDGSSGTEIWRVDGEQLIQLDIRRGPEGSHPAVISGREGVTFFWTGNGHGLWVTDGTLEGTVPVNATIAGPSMGSTVRSLTPVTGGLIFVDYGELWFSDGSALGTRRIEIDREFDYPYDLTSLGDRAYFIAGEQLWTTDGSDEGTVPLTAKTHPQNITIFNGRIFYTDSLGLWTSDGTIEGTMRVQDVSRATNLTNVNGMLYFLVLAHELWKSDGTQAGTNVVTNLLDTPENVTAELHAAQDQLFILFSFRSPNSTGAQIWRSDGSAEGTLRILKTDGYFLSAQPVGNKLALLFEPEIGRELWVRELWVSDGTPEGTGKLKDDLLIGGGNWPKLLTTVGDTLFFGANGSLWKTDGTQQGTVLVKNVRVDGDFSDAQNINGMLYFGADDGAATGFDRSDGETGLELWRSDGTEEGTVRLTDIAHGAAWSIPKYMTEVDGYIYFRANDGFHGDELWRIPVAPLPGDADGNGAVDFGDFLRLSANFGRDEDVVFADGDFDENGKIDFADFLILSKHFGRQSAPSAVQFAEEAPTTLVTMMPESVEELDTEQMPIEMLDSALR